MVLGVMSLLARKINSKKDKNNTQSAVQTYVRRML